MQLRYIFLVEITLRLLAVQSKKMDRQHSALCPDLLDQLDPRNHLLGLSKLISRQVFEDNRGTPHSLDRGSPLLSLRFFVRHSCCGSSLLADFALLF